MQINNANSVNQGRTTMRAIVGPTLVALATVVIATSCGSSSSSSSQTTSTPTSTATQTQAAPPIKVSPAQRRALRMYAALLKSPKKSSLPVGLAGSTTGPSKLSSGSRKHHAVGAALTTNGSALVGFLVFPTRAAALADLKEFPPDSGVNKVIGPAPKDFPRPAYLLSAKGNGYTARYVVFLRGNVLVNSWAYGEKGKGKSGALVGFVEQNARWGLARAAAAATAAS